MSIEIQDKEIRGVNLKWLISLVVVVATGTASYFGVISKIENMAVMNQSKFEMIQYQIQGLREENEQRKIENIDLKNELRHNRNDIDLYHPPTKQK